MYPYFACPRRANPHPLLRDEHEFAVGGQKGRGGRNSRPYLPKTAGHWTAATGGRPSARISGTALWNTIGLISITENLVGLSGATATAGPSIPAQDESDGFAVEIPGDGIEVDQA